MAKTNQVRYEYTADGTQRDFAVPFAYLEDSDVQVLVDNVVLDLDAYSVQSSGIVQLLAAPAAGSTVTVQRNTDARIPKNTFQAGSMLLPKPLDENFKQILYTVEEGVNTASDAVELSTAALTRAEQAEDFAGQAALDAADAKQYVEAAETLANTAASSAVQAAQQAGVAAGNASAALSTANTALNTANTASQTAVQASKNANYAVGVAEGIDQKAQDALDLSTNAIQRVEFVESIVDDIAAGGVASFNGRTGVVVPEADDYDIQMITGLEAALQAKADVSDLDALPELTKAQVEDADSDAFGSVSGRRLSEAVLKHSPPVAFGTTAGTAAEGNDPRFEGNVKTTGDQTIEGVKTYSSLPVFPSINPTDVNQAVRKGYVDTQIATRMPSSYLEQTLSNSAVKVPSSAAVVGYATPRVRVQALTTYGGVQKLTTPNYDWRNIGIALYIGDVFKITNPDNTTHFRSQLFTLEGLSSDGKTLTFNDLQGSSDSHHKQYIAEFSEGVNLLFERVCTGFEAHPTLGRSLVPATTVIRRHTSPRVDYPVEGNRYTTRLGTRAEQFAARLSGSSVGVHIDGAAYLNSYSTTRHVTFTLPAGSDFYFTGNPASSNVVDFWVYA